MDGSIKNENHRERLKMIDFQKPLFGKKKEWTRPLPDPNAKKINWKPLIVLIFGIIAIDIILVISVII